MRSKRAFQFRFDARAAFRLAAVLPLALVAAAILAACGGANGAVDGDAAGAEVATAKVDIVPPLFDEDGNAMPVVPQAQPADPAVLVKNGRYATAAQARLLAEVRKSDTLEIDVRCCGIEAVDFAVASVWVDQIVRDLPDSAPVIVRGSDLRLAALAANRLASGGLANVWLVSQ